MTVRTALPIVVVVVAGCTSPEPPAEPSWQVDIMPMFAANCVRCHAYPFRGGGSYPDGRPRVSALRLDSFDDVDLADGNVATGASKSIDAIFRRTHDINRLPGQQTMPPDRRLDDYELGLVRNWIALGNGMSVPRGPGHPDNRAPTLSIVEIARDATTVTFEYEVRDEDRDLVVGVVRGPRMIEDDEGTKSLVTDAVIGNVVAGRDRFTWDIDGVPAGAYALTAELDDGADVDPDGEADFIVVELGMAMLP